MKIIDIKFTNEKEKEDFVNKCEKDFEDRLDIASKAVVDSKEPFVIISGPTCAGKTTIANKVIDDFKALNKNVIIISLDDFFKERMDDRQVVDGEVIDYDSVDVLDLPLLKDCIDSMKIGNTFRIPQFDFITQKRKGYKSYTIKDNDVLIFEGIQAVYPEITSLFNNNYIGIFIDVCEDLCINGKEFTKNEIRLIRRLIRDKKFRGASPEFTFYLWESVRANEEKSIFPNKDACGIKIDSFMCYELFLMKKYLQEAFSEIPEESKYYKKAQSILDKISQFEEIDYKYIPKDSLYTEFLGKK